METSADPAVAADLLRRAHEQGSTLSELPADVRPVSRADGYRVQAAGANGEVLGWKIAATSADGQRHIGVDGPLAGRLLAEHLVADGDPVSLARNTFRLAELEFAFVAGQDFPPRDEPYSLAEVLDGTEKLQLSLEFPSTRFDSAPVVGEAQLIADNACAHQQCLADTPNQAWREADLATLAVTATARHSDGSPDTVHPGVGGNALGDPRTALVWLVNELSEHGIGLAAGQFVTTGTCVDPLPVRPSDTVTGDWGEFGTFTVRITD